MKRYPGGDTHVLCVACLGEEHARSALESTAMCFPCRHSDPAWRSFTMRALRLSFPQGTDPTVAKAQRRLQSWGSQIDLSVELETETALSLPSPDMFSASYQGWKVRAVV